MGGKELRPLDIEALPATVVVTDAATGERICDAEVHVTVADMDERLEAVLGDGGCVYIAQRGRVDAEHIVTVAADGYEPFSSAVYIPGGECGQPETARVEAALTAARR